MDDRFVSVYSKATGLKQRIPRAWLDNPVLCGDFEIAPKAEAVEEQRQMPAPPPAPDDEVLDQDPDLTPTPDADGTPPFDETPATGDNEEE